MPNAKTSSLFTRWVWWTIWSLSYLLPIPDKRDSLARWGWGIAFTAVAVCSFWYAIQCLVEARTSNTGGYVPVYAGHGYDRDWVDNRWAGPSEYRRSKYADVFVAMLFVGIFGWIAHKAFMYNDVLESPDQGFSYFMRERSVSDGYADMLGCQYMGYSGPYVEAGWKRIERKTARAFAKLPPGCCFYTVGGPDRLCSQRDYLSIVRNQKGETDVAILSDTRSYYQKVSGIM
jgi:hypothetical protein